MNLSLLDLSASPQVKSSDRNVAYHKGNIRAAKGHDDSQICKKQLRFESGKRFGISCLLFSPLDVGMATANWFQRGEGLISHYCGGANIHGSSFVNEPAIRKLARK